MKKLRARKHPPTKRQKWLEKAIRQMRRVTRGYHRSYLMSVAKLRYDQMEVAKAK